MSSITSSSSSQSAEPVRSLGAVVAISCDCSANPVKCFGDFLQVVAERELRLTRFHDRFEYLIIGDFNLCFAELAVVFACVRVKDVCDGCVIEFFVLA